MCFVCFMDWMEINEIEIVFWLECLLVFDYIYMCCGVFVEVMIEFVN